MQKEEKPIVLILCTGNSCRSHMAEGILRNIAGDLLDVRSAGSNPAGYVHPLAIRALDEIGIDISSHTSKHLDEFIFGYFVNRAQVQNPFCFSQDSFVQGFS